MTKEEWDLILALVGAGANFVATNPDATLFEKDLTRAIEEKFIKFVEAEKDSIS